MARYISSIVLNKPADFMQVISSMILWRKGIQFTAYKGENVWKLGSGVLTSPQLLNQLVTEPNRSMVEICLASGVYSGEMGLTAFGALIKASLREKNKS